jgi:NAD+ synthase
MKQIQPEEEIQKISYFLKNTFQKTGLSNAMIGLSGGVDSAVSLSLTARALGGENIFPMLLPYGVLSTQGTLDAMEMIQSVGIPTKNIIRIDIQPVVDMLSRVTLPDEVRKGNSMARTRMICLFDQAKKHSALVVGTENKTEHYLGYFTRFGDEASDIEPIRHLWKTQVYEVARALGVTEAILKKAPTAGLWPGQTDEEEFGFTYADADRILSMSIEEKLPIESIIHAGIPSNIIHLVLARVSSMEFKRKTPYVYTP